MDFLTLLALAFFTCGAIAQTCTRQDCEYACAQYAVVITHCNYDYRPNDNIQTCLCHYAHDFAGNLNLLNRCVACNLDGLISSTPLANFQGQEAICAKYVGEGESAALTVAAAAATDVVAAFSSTNLPQIQSIFCSSSVFASSIASTISDVVPSASSDVIMSSTSFSMEITSTQSAAGSAQVISTTRITTSSTGAAMAYHTGASNAVNVFGGGVVALAMFI